MRKLDTSSISTAAAMPIKAGTLVHLQLAYQEAITAGINAIIGPGYSATAMYILFGCVNSGSGQTYTISAGAVYLGGEVYQVAAASFTAPSGQVAVGTINAGFFVDSSADSVTFTDLVARNVHQIRTVVFASGVSGSGSCDFLSLLKANSAQVPLNSVVSYFPATGTLVEFDSTGKGITPNTAGWAVCNGANGTKNLSGMFLVGYSPTDSDYSVLFNSGGSKRATLAAGNIPAHTHQIHIDSSGGSYGGSGHLVSGNSGGSTVGPTTDGSEGGLAAAPFDTRPPYFISLYIMRIY